ncbi:MAG: TonB-dependent receptor [Labilithrix sp.]|nr:TonB-dependent receptor [Labilithrix sp.]
MSGAARRTRRASRAGRRRAASALVLAALTTAVAPARADDAASAESERAGEEREDEVRVRGRQVGGFVSRARIEDSPREITDAASLVEPLPGVHVRRLGADDSFATLSIRGSSSTQVAVYLAGVPLSGGADPSLDLATLPLWPGAQARVHRTFAPAALGRGSLGGTLAIDPPSPRAPSRTEVWTAAGSFGARRLRIGDVRGDPDGVRVATGVSASRSDDDFSFVDRGASDAAGREVFATRRNAGHAAAAGLASVGVPVRLGPASRGALTMTALAQARRQELPGSVRYPNPSQRLDSSRLVGALELTLPASREGSFLARGWGRREGLAIHDEPRNAREFASPASTDDAVIAAGGSTGWRGSLLEDTTLEVRIDGSGERFAPGTWTEKAAPPAGRRASAGVAVDASALLGGRVTLAASARGDTWIDSSEVGPTKSEQRPTGNVGLELPVGPAIVASHAGFVARPPSFVERYGNRGGFIGDENLRPESAFTVDAGARASRRFGPLGLHAEAAGFATWAEDLITFVYVGFQRQAKATNIGRARVLGIEAQARASAFGFDARVSHTALATANGSECEYVARRCERPPLVGRPAHDLVADLAWERGPLRLRYGVDLVSGIRADATGKIEVPARVLHGAGVRLAVPRAPGLSVTLDVRNLLDLRVADYAGVAIGGVPRTYPGPIGDLFDYPIPGRRVLLSLRFATDGGR